MRGRFLAAVLTVVAVLTPVAMAQTRQSRAAGWTPPKTAWGDPDLQGIWNNVTATPLQRSQAYKDRGALTDEEAEAFEREGFERRVAADATPPAQQSEGGRTGYSPVVWFETSYALSEGRTSLLVDPEDGRLPPLTTLAQKVTELQARLRRVSPADTPEDRGPYERCITRGLPGAMMPGFYNHNYHIFQTPGYVVISVEMIHDARIIPTDGRPPLPSVIKQWMGDSRGRWEGHTLVVETTNLRQNTGIGGTTEGGKVIERFTRLGPDRMDYRYTVDDPTWYTKSWTASVPMTKVKGPLYEYACHEGNYGLPNILAGHRKEEREAAEKR